MNSGIYAIINNINGSMYIGSSSNILHRFSKHRGDLSRGVHHSKYLQNAWNKYGEENFEFIIALECPVKELIKIEQKFIDYMKPEYNMCPIAGSTRGTIKSEESKRKIRDSKAKNPYRHDEERRRKISLAKLGTKQSEEHRKAIGAKSKGRRTLRRSYKGIISPTGQIFENITDLPQFCRANGLHYNSVCLIFSGKRKGYRGWKAIL